MGGEGVGGAGEVRPPRWLQDRLEERYKTASKFASILSELSALAEQSKTGWKRLTPRLSAAPAARCWHGRRPRPLRRTAAGEPPSHSAGQPRHALLRLHLAVWLSAALLRVLPRPSPPRLLLGCSPCWRTVHYPHVIDLSVRVAFTSAGVCAHASRMCARR